MMVMRHMGNATPWTAVGGFMIAVLFSVAPAFCMYWPCAAIRYARTYVAVPNQYYGSVPDDSLDVGRYLGDAANFMSQVIAAGCRNPCDPHPPVHQGDQSCSDCTPAVDFSPNCSWAPARQEHPDDSLYQHQTLLPYQDFHNELLGRGAAEAVEGPFGVGPRNTFFRCPTQLDQSDPIYEGSIIVFYFQPNNALPSNNQICNIAIVSGMGLGGITTIIARDKYNFPSDTLSGTNYLSDYNFTEYFEDYGYACTFDLEDPPNAGDFWTHFRVLNILSSDKLENLLGSKRTSTK